MEWELSDGDSSSSSSVERWRRGTGTERWNDMMGYMTSAWWQGAGGGQPKPFVGYETKGGCGCGRALLAGESESVAAGVAGCTASRY